MSTKMQNEKKQLMRFKLLQGSHIQNSPTKVYEENGVQKPVVEHFQAPRPYGDKDGNADPETIVESYQDLEAKFNWEKMPKKFERVHEDQRAAVAAKPQLVDYNQLKQKDQKFLLAFCEKYELDVPEGKTSKDDLLGIIRVALGAGE